MAAAVKRTAERGAAECRALVCVEDEEKRSLFEGLGFREAGAAADFGSGRCPRLSRRGTRRLVIPRTSRVRWPRAVRLVRSIYPRIDLFEDIADPADWELIAAAEAKTNPRVRDEVGAIHLVPPERRVAGPGASWAMAPFCHLSRDRPSRFSDGSYGVYYAGDRFEVALAEAVYHFERFMAATDEEPATADYRELISRIDADLHDLRDTAGFEAALDANYYAAAQSLAHELRWNHASNGIVYPGVRHPAGAAMAAFWPDVAGIPVPGRHLCYHWDGRRVDAWLVYGEADCHPR